jgi:hypothetical protein
VLASADAADIVAARVEVVSLVPRGDAMPEQSVGNMAGRVLLTLVGAAGLIVGAFSDWVKGIPGTHLGVGALYRTTFLPEPHMPVTVGFVVLAIGLVAVVGLATSGWLTRLAGALGIVVFILLWIQLYLRGVKTLPGPGVWLVLAGGLVAAMGGG